MFCPGPGLVPDPELDAASITPLGPCAPVKPIAPIAPEGPAIFQWLGVSLRLHLAAVDAKTLTTLVFFINAGMDDIYAIVARMCHYLYRKRK